MPRFGAHNRGFSFIELAVVLAILAITSTMALGFLLTARPHADLERAELELSARLNAARNLAVSEEVQVQVVFDTTAGTYFMQQRPAGGGTWVDVDGVDYELPESVTFTSITFPSTAVQFTTRGALLAGGNISLSSSTGEVHTLSGNLASGRFVLGQGNLR
jgi:prepilin-type N-terminal cleavage/methylation domain-containing protein